MKKSGDLIIYWLIDKWKRTESDTMAGAGF